MQLNYGGRRLQVFSLVPRTIDTGKYWSDSLSIIHLSDAYGFTGSLIFTGNDVFVEPWIVAQAMILRSEALIPLVAVNPIYMHPFTTARMVSSLAYVYRRRVFLNLITGTALSYLQAFKDSTSHDERYERLLEYTKIVKLLLSGRPVNFSGKFYNVERLQLQPAVPEALLPGYLVAGQSEAAGRLAREIGASSLQMLGPGLDASIGEARGINLGITTRTTEEDAWRAARRRFPQDREGQIMLQQSMKNTDSQWKQRLQQVAQQQQAARPGFWIEPFKNFQADQPIFVGSHDQVGGLIASLVRCGIDTFVLDLPAEEEEFDNVASAFRVAAERLA